MSEADFESYFDLSERNSAMLRELKEKISFSSERTYADRVLCTALDVGEGLLESGAEIRRVEDTMERICRAYGAEHVEVFAITATIQASVRMPNGEYSSQMRRVYGSSNNFRLREDFNALSRLICTEGLSIDEVQLRIREMRRSQKPHSWIADFGGAFAAAGFSVFFGGSLADGLMSGVIGLVMLIVGGIVLKNVGVFAKTLINSFIAGILTECAVHLYSGFHADMIMIATIMLLIPGSSFCNALRDLFSGDTFAGSARLVQSVLLALTIASGYSLAILIFGGVSL